MLMSGRARSSTTSACDEPLSPPRTSVRQHLSPAIKRCLRVARSFVEPRCPTRHASATSSDTDTTALCPVPHRPMYTTNGVRRAHPRSCLRLQKSSQMNGSNP